ncbi:MAG: hypothetical protein JSW71_12060 [Gemmatimonadota bacterium]|nr:MAG: hypothetical protein JSW71_12060 [Gemmatimonadota bacterium]
MESLVSHIVVGFVGAAVVWFLDRPVRRQFRLLMEAIDEGKQEGKDWRFVRDTAGRPRGIRIMYGASAPTDKPGSV